MVNFLGSSLVSVALGTFDGVHLGHKSVLDTALSGGYCAEVVTFKKVPRFELMGKNEGLVMTPSEKKRILLNMGFHRVHTLDFDEVKDVSAADFLEFLTSTFNPQKICCGYNYRFGRGAEGDTKMLREYCRRNDIEFYAAKEVSMFGVTVSSTAIRNYIGHGDMKRASAMLGRPFYIFETVVEGDKRGRTMGFPTINQLYPDELVRPRFGVYATVVEIDGKKYPSVTNIGVRPTFLSDRILSETHILGFSGDLYGRAIKTEFLEFMRDETKFSGLAELKNAIENDKNKRINL